ncbi:MAG TPA: hypothetical protein VFW87_06490 [Pirellulales bacterium]|nr:hypothetical protein [Pirellulales bacterium]
MALAFAFCSQKNQPNASGSVLTAKMVVGGANLVAKLLAAGAPSVLENGKQTRRRSECL